MGRILINNVLCGGRRADVLIEGNRIAKIGAALPVGLPAGNGLIPADGAAGPNEVCVIDGTDMAAFPPFYNCHCHAAMTLLRGYADDLELFEWLNKHIWPAESKLTHRHIEVGSRLAVLEMIKSGTVFFADMYWMERVTQRVVEEIGVRACLGVTILERAGNRDELLRQLDAAAEWDSASERLQIAIAPHAIYTVGAELLKTSRAVASRLGCKFMMHLSESRAEVANCKKECGLTPVEYADSLGLLSPDTVLAHCVHLTPHDIELLRDSGSVVALNPCSNMKLSSGFPPVSELLEAGCRLTLGTDGASSNNSLDMREEMKFAALAAKLTGAETTLSAQEVFRIATRNGAQAFGIDAGTLEEGRLADLVLVNLDNERMQPCHNAVSNYVYAADSSAIDTVICDGRVLMRNRRVEGEEEIIDEVKDLFANDFLGGESRY